MPLRNILLAGGGALLLLLLLLLIRAQPARHRPLCVVRGGQIEVRSAWRDEATLFTKTSAGRENRRSVSSVPFLGSAKFFSRTNTENDSFRWEVIWHGDSFDLEYDRPCLIRTVRRIGKTDREPPLETFQTYVLVTGRSGTAPPIPANPPFPSQTNETSSTPDHR